MWCYLRLNSLDCRERIMLNYYMLDYIFVGEVECFLKRMDVFLLIYFGEELILGQEMRVSISNFKDKVRENRFFYLYVVDDLVGILGQGVVQSYFSDRY